MILATLERITPEWRQWAEYVKEQIGNRSLTSVGGKGVAQYVLSYCGCKLPEKGIARLDYLCSRFGIISRRFRQQPSNLHEGVASVLQSEDELFPDARILLAQYKNRSKNAYAHEVGHFFCAVAWELAVAQGLVGVPQSYDERERWCWGFAIEFMCPAFVRNRWDPGYLYSLYDGLDDSEEHNILLTVGRIYTAPRCIAWVNPSRLGTGRFGFIAFFGRSAGV